MLKKILLASAVLASSVAMASPSPYVGAGFGVTVTTPNGGSKGAAFNSFRGMPLNVFAGYGGVIDQNFYLAGELLGTVATGEISGSGVLKSTYGYSLSLLPGIMLSDHTLAFVRAGVVRTHFSNLSVNKTGGQAGVGLQTSLTQNVDLRGEYDFTAYQHVNSAGQSTAPRQDQFNLSLVYKFD